MTGKSCKHGLSSMTCESANVSVPCSSTGRCYVLLHELEREELSECQP